MLEGLEVDQMVRVRRRFYEKCRMGKRGRLSRGYEMAGNFVICLFLVVCPLFPLPLFFFLLLFFVPSFLACCCLLFALRVVTLAPAVFAWSGLAVVFRQSESKQWMHGENDKRGREAIWSYRLYREYSMQVNTGMVMCLVVVEVAFVLCFFVRGGGGGGLVHRWVRQLCRKFFRPPALRTAVLGSTFSNASEDALLKEGEYDACYDRGIPFFGEDGF